MPLLVDGLIAVELEQQIDQEQYQLDADLELNEELLLLY